jgi:hypothetical protein
VIPFFEKNKAWFIEAFNISHPFTIGNLQASPEFTGFEFSIALLLVAGTIGALYFFAKRKGATGIGLLFGSSALFIWLTILLVAPRIEKYTQHAYIQFLKEKGRENAYVASFFKSYAVLFYTQVQPGNKVLQAEVKTLATRRKLDRPAYFVARTDKKNEIMNRYPLLDVYEEKNGYVFFQRLP